MDEPRSLPFRPGDMSWRVTREPVLGLGAAPTLLLQVTHPLVAVGVEQYSDFESDPFSRLWRTADIMLKLSFAEPEVSQRQARILHSMHKRISGVSDEGVPYRALDPDLLMWVWATLVHNALDLYERTFGRLPDADRERFYAEQQLIAHACGVPEDRCPPSHAAFRDYFDQVVREELRPTSVSRKLIGAGTGPARPLPASERCGGSTKESPRNGEGAARAGGAAMSMPWPLGPAYTRLNLIAAGALLPQALRRELGIPWSRSRARAFAALIAANRAAARVVPTQVRHRPTDYLVARDRPLRLFQQTRRAA